MTPQTKIQSSDKGKVVFFYPTVPESMASDHVWFPFPYLYLAPFLEAEGFPVKIIDARVDRDWKDILESEIADARYFGVTGMSGPDLTNAVEACELVRDIDPSVRIVWGGHHARMVPDQILHEGIGDYVFTGKAEYSLRDLLLALESGSDYSEIQGIVYLKDGKAAGDRTMPRVNFDYDHYPAFHLLDVEKYRSSNNIVAAFSSIGCPFNCSFCTAGKGGDDFMFLNRTMDQVKEELNILLNGYKFKSLFYTDVIFFHHRKRVLEIAQHLRDEYPGLKWKAAARVESMGKYSEEELNLLRDSGLRSVMFGVESGSEAVIKRMNKRNTAEQVYEAARICRDYDFEFYGSFMFFTPHETIDDLRQTICMIREIKRIYPKAVIQNSIFMPLPGTPMNDMCFDLGYEAPNSTAGWAERSFGHLDERYDDIVWMEEEIKRPYAEMYKAEFPDESYVFERERDGSYAQPLAAQQLLEAELKEEWGAGL